MSYVFNPFTGNFDQKLNISTEISGNIALNGGYISNDGEDEGISISDSGVVSMPQGILLGTESGTADVMLTANYGTDQTILKAYQTNVLVPAVGDGGINWYWESQIFMKGAADPALIIHQTNNNYTGGKIRLSGQENGYIGQVNGKIEFAKSKAEDEIAAYIYSRTDATDTTTGADHGGTGTNNDGDWPSNLVFSTTANGAATPTDRMTIGSDGVVTIVNDLSLTDGTSQIFDFDTANCHLRIFDDADTDGDRDYFDISVGAAGATTISTNDDGGSAADLTIDPDGDIILEPASLTTVKVQDGENDALRVVLGSTITHGTYSESGSENNFHIYEPDSTNDFCMIRVQEHGATTISTVDANAAVAHLTIEPDGELNLTPAAGTTTNTGKLLIDYDSNAPSAGNKNILEIDTDIVGAQSNSVAHYPLTSVYNSTEATGGFQTVVGINSNVTQQMAADDGINFAFGIVNSVTGSSNGSSMGSGITNTVTGFDSGLGISQVVNGGSGTVGFQQNVTDGQIDIKLLSSADTGDYFSISTGANAATTIATVDDDNNEAAHLTFDIQGDTIFKGDIADGTSTEICRMDASVSALTLPANIKLMLGAAGEYIVGDGTDMVMASSGAMLITTSVSSGTGVLSLSSGAEMTLGSDTGVFNFRDDGDADDAFKITVAGGTGATTLETISDGGDGDLTILTDGSTIVDRNVSNTSAGTYTGFSVDFDKTGSSSSNNTLYALIIDADNATATSGMNTLYGIRNTPTLTHASDGGTTILYGLSQIVTGSTNGSSTATGISQTVTGADTQIGFDQKVDDGGIDIKLKSSANTNDYFTIATTANGATTLTTVDGGGAAANLNFTVDGAINFNATNIVEFDGCGVGFDLVTPTYNASDTDVDFQTGNKQFVTFGGDITDLNLIFPKTSGNFTLLLKQDGTGSRTVTNYKVWDVVNSDAASGSATVKFAGGSNPTLTTDANHVDIISFFWDADNEIAYGVASLDFQF